MELISELFHEVSRLKLSLANTLILVSKTLGENPAILCPSSDLQKFEILSDYCFKLLSL